MMSKVYVERCRNYNSEIVDEALNSFDNLFSENIQPGQTVVIKPNWIAPHHKYNPNEWESVITHPNFITGVIKKIVYHLKDSGKIIIADAPQTDSQFKKIAEKYPFNEWEKIGRSHGVEIEIIDLREHEWINKGDVIISRKMLPGDPLGSVEFNLRGQSEFRDHTPSSLGYYGADCFMDETTRAHSGNNHIYRLSRSVIKADVFINLPKWKTHKKAGITCSLKNLVGINTYKNYLPHHTEGTPSMGGDQFPNSKINSFLEVYFVNYFKKILSVNEKYSKYMVPVKKAGKVFFGETKDKIRSGNWYGNNTIWRTILDLNKLLLYGKENGTLRESNISQQKRYLSLIDGIIAGDGNGPEAPDRVNTQMIIGGCNPVSVDCVAAKLMGFNYLKIPSIANAFKITHYPLIDFTYDKIEIHSNSLGYYNCKLQDLSKEICFRFKPHFGWIGNIEL